MKLACDGFLAEAEEYVLGTVVGFVAKYAAVDETDASQLGSARDEGLKLWAEVEERLHERLPHVRTLLALFLETAVTQRILYRPLKVSLLELCGRWKGLCRVSNEGAETGDDDIVSHIDRIKSFIVASDAELVTPLEAARRHGASSDEPATSHAAKPPESSASVAAGTSSPQEALPPLPSLVQEGAVARQDVDAVDTRERSTEPETAADVQ